MIQQEAVRTVLQAILIECDKGSIPNIRQITDYALKALSGEVCYRCKRGEHKEKCASDFCTCCGNPDKNGKHELKEWLKL